MRSNYFPKIRPVYALLLLVALATLLVPTSALAQGASERLPRHVNMDDPTALESFWDAFFAEQMERLGVHGATMVAVAGDDNLFAKGYGYADATQERPFDPENTILRGGSIAKTVTALAIMQLAEEGKIDLDANVNEYLTLFQVPDTFAEPVTARQLINMTGGFDTRLFGVRVSSPDELQPLGEYLADRLPPRTEPPGRVRRYNDHEIALAGYLVEVVAGVPFEQYVRQNIFAPLQMNSSTILLPDDQLSLAERGYPVGGGPDDAYPLNYYYLNDAPGSGFNTSAADIARYMIAHLADGRYVQEDGTEVRILEEETAHALLETAFAYRPNMVGQVNSWDEEFYNGQRYLKKSGGAPGIHNQILLFPEQDLGFYLNYNSGGAALRNNWHRAVEEMILGAPAEQSPETDIVPNGTERARNYAGYYIELHDDIADSNLLKINGLVTPGKIRRVIANDDGSLDIAGRHYVQVEPGTFQSTSSGFISAFDTGADGRATHLLQSRFAYRRLPWYETPPVQIGLLVLSLLIFLSGVTAWAVALFRRHPRGRWLSGLVSLLNLLFLVGLVLVLMPVITGGDKWMFFFEPKPSLLVVLALPLSAAVLSLGLLLQTAWAWLGGRFTLAMRVHNSLVFMGAMAFLFFLSTWNLLGYRF